MLPASSICAHVEPATEQALSEMCILRQPHMKSVRGNCQKLSDFVFSHLVYCCASSLLFVYLDLTTSWLSITVTLVPYPGTAYLKQKCGDPVCKPVHHRSSVATKPHPRMRTCAYNSFICDMARALHHNERGERVSLDVFSGYFRGSGSPYPV